MNLTAHGNACTTMRCTGLGAQWSSKAPTTAILTIVIFNDIQGIAGAKLNVDGNIVDLRPTHPFTNFSRPGAAVRESRIDAVVPLQLVRSVATARKAWLRVSTNDGYLEDAIVDGNTESKALHALRRFLAEVDKAGS